MRVDKKLVDLEEGLVGAGEHGRSAATVLRACSSDDVTKKLHILYVCINNYIICLYVKTK